MGNGNAEHIGMNTAIGSAAPNNIAWRAEYGLRGFIQFLLDGYADFLNLIAAICRSDKGESAK